MQKKKRNNKTQLSINQGTKPTKKKKKEERREKKTVNIQLEFRYPFWSVKDTPQSFNKRRVSVVTAKSPKILKTKKKKKV